MADEIKNDDAKGAPDKSKAAGKDDKSAQAPAANETTKVNVKQPAEGTTPKGSGLPQQVDLMWTVALVVVAFVLGFLVNALLFSGGSAGTLTSGTDGSTGAPTVSAPTLSQDQLKGPLPEGHPNINAEATPTGGDATKAPAGSATAKPGDAPSSGASTPGDTPVEAPKDKESGK